MPPSSSSHSYLLRLPRGISTTQRSSSAMGPRVRVLARAQTRLGRDGHVGEVEVGPAAHAHGVVELDHPAAARALAAELVSVPAVEEGGGQSDDRDDRADEEPEPEARALAPAHE